MPWAKAWLFLVIAAAICAIQNLFILWLLPDTPSSTVFFGSRDLYSTIGIRQSALLPVEKLWEDYKTWHSENSLERDPWNRKFQVIYYSCPQAAGNLMHDFINQVIISVATNRTMLWKYSDQETCYNIRKGLFLDICHKANDESDCNQSVIRAPWLPSFDTWAPKLFEKNISLPLRHPATFNSSDWMHRRLVAFKPMVFQIQAWRHQKFLNTTASYNMLQDLYSSSSDFLYGMLFRELFTFRADIVPPEFHQQSNNTRTFVLHSRHISTADEGGVTSNERKCLKSMLDINDRSPCIIYLMSDREVTIERLSTYIPTKWPFCTPIVATHVQQADNAGHYLEHGPFAGTGFFQDLIVGSQARDGLIGSCSRTSTLLLRELVQYDRAREAIQMTGSPPKDELPVCCLPDRGNL
jgi:hypothetical protein